MSDPTFSLLNRPGQLAEAARKEFDLLVVGGGITGVGIALDAALRGLSVCLVEKQDFAAGTSSRSTKLIHGGLRYLKQLEINLVREVGRERDIVYRNAPHLVVPERMLLPIVKGGSLGKLSASVGLYVYDLLAGVSRSERRSMLGIEMTMLREPLLRKSGLLGGAMYWEYRSDDARLVISIARKAAMHGASLLPYCKLNELVYHHNEVVGAQCTDQIGQTQFEVRARKVVNAAGPWVDDLRQLDQSLFGKRLHLTKGVHIVVPFEKLPLKQSIYFDVPDGRMIFAIPRDGATYIGTTDTDFSGNRERPEVTKADVDYLLKAVNGVFDMAPLSPTDVTSTWCGLRPLIHQDGRSPSELSRKDEIFISKSGLISIAGGKLTGYRKMAQRTVDVVMKHFELEDGIPNISSTTNREPLAGGDFESPEAFRSFARNLTDAYAEQFSRDDIWRIAQRYGTHASQVMARASLLINQQQSPALLLSEAEFGVSHEYVTTLSDLLIRRTGMLYFDRQTAVLQAHAINEHLSQLLQWDEKTKNASLSEFFTEAKQVLEWA